MFLKIWRFITVMFISLSMGMALCHLLELPAKMEYDGSLWLKLLHTLYPVFGTVGAAFEGGALLTTIVLSILVRHRKPSFQWTILGLMCIIATSICFWIWVMPVNLEMQNMTADTLPADWMQLRNQWEYAHAIRAVLQIIALGALLISLLIEIPDYPLKNPT